MSRWFPGKEVCMATVKDINVKNYCDTVYSELSGMKKRIDAMMDGLEKTYGTESEVYEIHSRHLCELADFIDWKIQILTKVCPFDWKGMGEEYENTVSVGEAEKSEGPEFSGGYIGG